MTGIIILGATGSIGLQTLEVLDYLQKQGDTNYELIGVSCHKNITALEKIIHNYEPRFAVVTDDEAAFQLSKNINSSKTQILKGSESLLTLIKEKDVKIVVNSLVGIAGLAPSLLSLQERKILALANKESLVTGGALLQRVLKENESVILPIDSEHSALWQLLKIEKKANVDKLILTASGGPFRTLHREDFKDVTPEKALKHPTWSMGGKISIDSATLMNKALEVIEAHWLFDFPYDKIDVVVHPESIVHSFIQLTDKSLIAQMGVADMRMPIMYALTYPKRLEGLSESMDLVKAQKLTFEPPRMEDFPALGLGYEAGKIGGTMPVVLNGVNEVAVESFLAGKISFSDIAYYIEKVMAKHKVIEIASLENIYDADEWARQEFYREVC